MGDVEDMLEDLEEPATRPPGKKAKKVPKKQEDLELDIDKAWSSAARDE
jgi:hypothetical protein